MKRILPLIVISQFFCSSVWFAGNAILPDIAKHFQLSPGFLAHLTSAVQLGFICGTLIFAIFTIADRFSPSRVFFVSALIAGSFNLAVIIEGISASQLLLFRFSTGFFLAGVYPVGMKIASDYFKERLGRSLGFLVGALVLGTAFPHLLRSLTAQLPWRYVIISTSALSLLGGAAVLLFVSNGPHHRAGAGLNFTAFFKGFRNKNFRAAAFGYFGHQWELYTFWAFVPVTLASFGRHAAVPVNIPLWSFFTIAMGGIGCACNGMLSRKYEAGRLAIAALTVSGLCCLLSPLVLSGTSLPALQIFLLVWGFNAAADSPMYSALIAKNAPAETRGTSLTIVNCIGFAITIVSIQFVNMISAHIPPQYLYVVLVPGPMLGLVALVRNQRNSR